eukprot:ANDGO_02937.mRNA.1 hypothetical protein
MQRRGLLVVLLLVVFAISRVRGQADACTIRQRSQLTLSSLSACFSLLPYDRTRAFQLFAGLQSAADLYVQSDLLSVSTNNRVAISNTFENDDNSVNTYPGFDPLPQNLSTMIRDLGNTPWPNDYEMHRAIWGLLQRAGDFNLRYFGPTNYNAFSLVFPFSLAFSSLPTIASAADAGAPEIVFTAASVAVFSDGTSTYDNYRVGAARFADQVGKVVTAVNGLAPMDFVRSMWMPRWGVSKDASARLNSVLYALAQTPAPAFELFDHLAFDFGGDPQSVEIRFADGSLVAAPWIVDVPYASFANADDFYRRNLIGSTHSNLNSASASTYCRIARHGPDEANRDADDDVARHEAKTAKKMENPAMANFLTVQFASGDDAMGVWCATGFNSAERGGGGGGGGPPGTKEDTLLLRLAYFSPPAENQGFEKYLEALSQCLNYANSTNLRRLVIDLRHSHGQDMCLATYMMNMIFSSKWGSLLQSAADGSVLRNSLEVWDLKKSKTLNSIVDCIGSAAASSSSSSPSWSPRIDPASLDYLEGVSAWYTTSVSSSAPGAPRPGSTFTAKALFPGACVKSISQTATGIFSSTASNSWTSVVMMTDGLCRGACSYFLSHVRRVGSAAIIAKGGLPDSNLMDSSTSSSSSLQWNAFVDLLSKSYSDAQSRAQIVQFPFRSTLLFHADEMYLGAQNAATAPGIPRDFVRIPPDVRDLSWNFQEDGVIYDSTQAYYQPLSMQISYSKAYSAAYAAVQNDTLFSLTVPLAASFVQSVESQGKSDPSSLSACFSQQDTTSGSGDDKASDTVTVVVVIVVLLVVLASAIAGFFAYKKRRERLQKAKSKQYAFLDQADAARYQQF